MAAYNVELSRVPEDVYRWLFKKDLPLFERVRAVLNSLAGDPFQGKPLKGELKGMLSYRLGSYRILYEVHRTRHTVRVLDIAHRREVYR